MEGDAKFRVGRSGSVQPGQWIGKGSSGQRVCTRDMWRRSSELQIQARVYGSLSTRRTPESLSGLSQNTDSQAPATEIQVE